MRKALLHGHQFFLDVWNDLNNFENWLLVFIKNLKIIGYYDTLKCSLSKHVLSNVLYILKLQT